MTTDKVFILLLVIMLPLTGCLDMTDNADASDPVDNSTMAETTPEVFSLHMEPYTNTTLTFDGDSTMKLESLFVTMHDPEETSPPISQHSTTFSKMQMTCNGTLIIEKGYISTGYYLPVLGGQLCTIELSSEYDWEYILIFSEASLASL